MMREWAITHLSSTLYEVLKLWRGRGRGKGAGGSGRGEWAGVRGRSEKQESREGLAAHLKRTSMMKKKETPTSKYQTLPSASALRREEDR